MARTSLQRRIANVERRVAVVAAHCPACGGAGPVGIVFAIHPDEPVAPPPCPRCGRESSALLFRIAPAARPGRETPVIT